MVFVAAVTSMAAGQPSPPGSARDDGGDRQASADTASGRADPAEAREAIEARLVAMARRWYIASSPEEREAVLTELLSDPLASLRRLGLELSVQRLLDQRPFGEPLREALRRLLDDPDAELRELAARRLADLQDEPAASIAAARLSRSLPLASPGPDAERSRAVLAAYLDMVTRTPRPDLAGVLVDLLQDSELRDRAAAALAAMARRDMLGDEGRAWVRSGVRLILRQRGPQPGLITLLGLLADDKDWRGWGAWLDHEDAGVRGAAARAWVAAERPLEALLVRSSDPVIAPVLVAQATERGDGPALLSALVAMSPDASMRAAWRAALSRAAGTVAPGRAIEAATRLREAGDDPEAVEAVLNAAISGIESRATDPDDGASADPARQDADRDRREASLEATAQRGDLLLMRAEHRLDQRRARDAMADAAEAVAAFDAGGHLDQPRGRHARALLVSASVLAGEPDAAATAIGTINEQLATGEANGPGDAGDDGNGPGGNVSRGVEQAAGAVADAALEAIAALAADSPAVAATAMERLGTPLERMSSLLGQEALLERLAALRSRLTPGTAADNAATSRHVESGANKPGGAEPAPSDAKDNGSEVAGEAGTVADPGDADTAGGSRSAGDGAERASDPVPDPGDPDSGQSGS